MIDLYGIRDQVLQNCDISDAKHAGLFSVCGLALRLRDLFKWENKLEPWVEKDAAEVLEWIGKKESLWETLNQQDYRRLLIQGRSYDPFDTREINRVLSPHGVFYGAGYGRSLKPTFLLSRVKSKKTIHGTQVVVLAEELARDLFTVPAFVQDDCIGVRTQTAKNFLWDRICYVNKSGKRALTVALKTYGLDLNRLDEVKPHLETIAADESEIYARHEVGEIQDTVFQSEIWREIIAAYPHSPVELLARGIRDLLADTHAHGTLSYIIRHRRTSSLAFYVAFMEGLPRKLFGGLVEAFDGFLLSEDWAVVESAAAAGRGAAQSYADTMTRIFKQGKQRNDQPWAEKEISRCLLEPLMA